MSEITQIKTGNRMSQIVFHNDTIYLSGQAGNPGDGITEQTKTSLENVESLLNEVGPDKTRILECLHAPNLRLCHHLRQNQSLRITE